MIKLSPYFRKSISIPVLFLFTFFCFTSYAQDFNVQHIQDDIGNSGGTNTSFTAVSSLNNAVALANNNRKVNAGSGGGNMEGDDLAGARQLTGTGTLTYYRESGSSSLNMRFNTSIWEYIGTPGGNNEMIVRGRYAVSLNGTTNSVTQALTGITNANDCIPFINGIMNNDSGNGADSGTAIAYLENATTLRVQKGTTSNNVTVYITVVEFTGSNWTVLHGDSTPTGSNTGNITLTTSSTGTGTTASVSSWSDAIIFSHHRGDTAATGTNEAIADNWPVMSPGTTSQVAWTFHSDHGSNGTNRQFVHVLNNTGLNVTRYTDTANAANESTIDISSASLSSINEALIVGTSTSSGGGTAYARGWRNYYFNSTTQAAHWSHRNNNTMSHEIQIVDLAGLTAPAPEINVTGSGNNILDGDSTPTGTDGTDFGNVDVTSGSQANTFTIQNLGTVNLTLTADPSSPFNNVRISGTHASDFTVTTDATSPISGPSGTSNFIITFNPSATGLRSATVTIINNDSSEGTYNFDIQGTGTNTAFSNVTVSVDWPAYSSENTVEIYSPSAVLLGTITDPTGTGNSSYSETLNLGCLQDLSNYYFIMYDSADDGWDGSDNITITVDGVAVINQNGNSATAAGFSTNFNVSGTSTPEIHISGNGSEIVDGDTTPSNGDLTDFGKVELTQSKSNTYTIANQDCSTSLVISGIAPQYVAISGTHASDFAVTLPYLSTPIAADTSDTFEITFTAGGLGLRTATVTVTNNDPTGSEGTYNFDIQGEGIPLITEGPGGVTADLQLWLKSTDGLGYTDGTSVSTWSDQARGEDATVNTVGQEPTFKDNATDNINFNPVVDFDNTYNPVPIDSDFSYDDTTTEFLEGTGGFYTQDIFMVLIPDTTVNSSFGSMDLFCGDEDESTDATDASGLGFGSYSIRFTNEVISYAVGTTQDIGGGVQDGYGVAETGSGTYNNVGILNARNNSGATQQELYYNANDIEDTQNDIPDFSNVNDSRYWIGRSEGWEASTDARIAEIITYSSRQSDATLTDNRNRIQSYLAIKYGITLGVNGTSQDYVNSSGTLIWDQDTGVPANDVFNHDIAGIGRDDDSDLNQKQSKTVNTADDITIGLTDIATTNSANSNTFSTDESFVVWGNNDGVLTVQPDVIVDMSSGIGGLTTNVDFKPSGRTWKVVETGTVGTTKISAPHASILAPLGLPPGDYLMFISSTPTFSPTAEYRIMYTNDGGTTYETDYDFSSGEQYITFGFAPEYTFVRSIYFDGTNDYLDADDPGASNDNLDLTGSFTISSWIKRDAGSVNQDIVSKRNSGSFTNGYGLRISNAGRATMFWKNNGGPTQTIQSTNIVPENEWHHIAVTFVDGGDTNIYIDGILEGTEPSLATPVDNTEHFLIGAANYLSRTNLFQGNIDEVRVWDVALSADQLRYVMNQEIEENGSMNADGKIIPTSISKNDISSIPWTNLKGYYPMSRYTFTNSKDESGYDNTAALKNLTTVDEQTAPLPYTSSGSATDWNSNSSWTNGSMQTIPGGVPYTFSVPADEKTVDWNIVETNHDLTMDNSSLPSSTLGDDNRTLLALMVKSNEITVDGDTSTGDGNGLTVTHYLELDGVIDLEGESQLIQTNGSDLETTSAGSIERDQQGTANSYTYNYWSSPVSQIGTTGNNIPFAVKDVLSDGTNPAAPVPVTFCDGAFCADDAAINTSTYWLYKLVNNGNAYTNWEHIGSHLSLNVTEGYSMKGVSAASSIATEQNYTFIGKPNNVLNGDTEITHTTFPGTFDGNGNAFITLTGNPFPSAIDADAFITDNISILGGGSDGITGTLYFWEHWGGGSHNWQDYQGGYATYTLAGGTQATSHPDVDQTGSGSKEPGQYVPVGQGFYVMQQHEFDVDDDGISDLTDPDIDGDGILNGADNCPYTANPGQEDADSDGTGNVCDSDYSSTDTDGDGILDAVDNCPTVANPGQVDANSNGIGDACEITLINPSSGSVIFRNSQRVFEKEFGNTESIFTRSTASNSNNIQTNSNKQRIWIDFETSEGYHRQLLAAFVEGATDGIDRGYDGRASSFMSNDIFFYQESKYYVIQAFGEYNVEREIPFAVFVDADNDNETQTLSIDKLENISDDIEIYIKDNETGQTHSIRNQSFEFSLPQGEYRTKFSLVFKAAQSLSVEEELLDAGLNVFMNNNTSTVDITKTVDTEINQVTLFNYLGQSMQIWSDDLSNNELHLPVNKVSTGVYILKIETNNKTISKKIVIE